MSLYSLIRTRKNRLLGGFLLPEEKLWQQLRWVD